MPLAFGSGSLPAAVCRARLAGWLETVKRVRRDQEKLEGVEPGSGFKDREETWTRRQLKVLGRVHQAPDLNGRLATLG